MKDLDLEMAGAVPDLLAQLLAHPDPFLREAAEGTRTHQARTGVPAPWHGYFARKGAEWVGICAFVDQPNAAGEVEIAYGTVPGREGRGIATAMAEWLVARAFAHDLVTAVTANTAPEEGPSTAILKKLGFVRDGVVRDAEIGEAWHWRKARG